MQDKYNLGYSLIQGGITMEQAMINLMSNLLTEEDIRYISALESKCEIEDDVYSMMNDLKLFFFKKGFRSGINMLYYCEK
jgi:hypothetical protein